MKVEEVESHMNLMPSGIPVNDDTWVKLHTWICKNADIVAQWAETPPTIEEEESIYNIFGCTSPITMKHVIKKR